MTIPYTVATYLHNHDVEYDVLTHLPTLSSQRTAQAAHVPGNQLAKAVVLNDGTDFVMAVIPASHMLETSLVFNFLQRTVEMSPENDFTMVFRDCQLGAIPPIGDAYGMVTIIDDALRTQSEIYLEGGDHQHLVHLHNDQFLKLIEGWSHGSLSSHL